MAAGGLTGALYKSTGASSDVSSLPDHLSHRASASWREARVRSGHTHVWDGWRMELCQTERLGYIAFVVYIHSNPYS